MDNQIYYENISMGDSGKCRHKSVSFDDYEKQLSQYLEQTDTQLSLFEDELKEHLVFSRDNECDNPRKKTECNRITSSKKTFWNRVHEFYFQDNMLTSNQDAYNGDVFAFIDGLSTGSTNNKKLYLNYLRISHRKMELFCNAYELDRGYSPIKLARERSSLRCRLSEFEALCYRENIK